MSRNFKAIRFITVKVFFHRDHAATDWNHSEGFSLFSANSKMTDGGIVSCPQILCSLFHTPLNNGGGQAKKRLGTSGLEVGLYLGPEGPGVSVPPPCEATSCEVFPSTVIIRNMLI